MNRIVARWAVVVVALVVGGCAPPDSGSLGRLPTGPQVSPTPGPRSGSPNASDTIVDVWLIRGGALAQTTRTRSDTADSARLALTELTAGPSAVEAQVGMSSAIPADAELDVSISGRAATVDASGAFFAGGRAVTRLRRAQVVYTLTQFPAIATVGFSASGTPREAPTGRRAYADLLPPIVVTSPVIATRVTSPVTVSGTAGVFEATVSVRILDAAGTEIATTFTTAGCGTGCRGSYAVPVSYRLDRDQAGIIQVYEVSAEDGSRINVVDIPVTLAAGR